MSSFSCFSLPVFLESRDSLIASSLIGMVCRPVFHPSPDPDHSSYEQDTHDMITTMMIFLKKLPNTQIWLTHWDKVVYCSYWSCQYYMSNIESFQNACSYVKNHAILLMVLMSRSILSVVKICYRIGYSLHFPLLNLRMFESD